MVLLALGAVAVILLAVKRPVPVQTSTPPPLPSTQPAGPQTKNDSGVPSLPGGLGAIAAGAAAGAAVANLYGNARWGSLKTDVDTTADSIMGAALGGTIAGVGYFASSATIAALGPIAPFVVVFLVIAMETVHSFAYEAARIKWMNFRSEIDTLVKSTKGDFQDDVLWTAYEKANAYAEDGWHGMAFYSSRVPATFKVTLKDTKEVRTINTKEYLTYSYGVSLEEGDKACQLVAACLPWMNNQGLPSALFTYEAVQDACLSLGIPAVNARFRAQRLDAQREARRINRLDGFVNSGNYAAKAKGAEETGGTQGKTGSRTTKEKTTVSRNS